MSCSSIITGTFSCLIIVILPKVLYGQGTTRIDTLSNLTIEDTRSLFRGILDMRRLSHSVAVGRIAKDQRLATYVDGFMERNNVDVFTIAYIDSDQFWPNVFKNWSLKKLSQQPKEKLLSAKARFIPNTSGGKVVGYSVDLELEGRSNQVFELLQMENITLEAIVGAVNADNLPDNFKNPSDAKETVISALIYALEQTEGAMGETVVPEPEVLIASDYRIRYQGNDYETGAILVINEEERPVQLELVHKDGNVIPEELVVSWSPESISADGRKATLILKESSEPLSVSASFGDVDLKAKIINGSKIVSIEEMEEPFYAGIDNNTLKIKYAIDAPSELELKYVKLEVFDNRNTLVYSNENDMRITRGGLFEWDGKMNVGPYANQYIRNDQSEFEVRITTSSIEDYSEKYNASKNKEVDQTADEWNTNPKLQGFVVPDGDFDGTAFEYYLLLRPKFESTIPALIYIDYSGPFDYLEHRIEWEATFLGNKFPIHKTFYKRLKKVENILKEQGTYDFYANKYKHRINGALAIRNVRESNFLSQHSLAMAIDVDPRFNLDIRKQRAKEIFKVIKYVTGTDMFLNVPEINEMKAASENFKEYFNEDYISLLRQQSKKDLEKAGQLYKKVRNGGRTT